jgi:aldose 1-epimerase
MSEIVNLTDQTGAKARIQTAFGFNCYSFRSLIGGQEFETLWSAEGFERDKSRASGSGIPLLFPFPGRIRGVVFTWKGKEYPQTAGDGRGNAIHGFVHERPWRVVEQSASSVSGEFHAAADDPSLAARWPADFRIRVTYSLTGGVLEMHARIDNPGQSPLPCGFGAHPYFRVPLGAGSSAEDCLVQLPVSKKWELIDMLPTGRSVSVDAGAFARGSRFGQMALDDVFTGLTFSGGQCTARIVDDRARRALSLSFDRAFRECVVYNPAHRQAICIEPYTCLPGAFSLSDQGIDAGLRVLQPGEAFEARMSIRLERLDR